MPLPPDGHLLVGCRKHHKALKINKTKQNKDALLLRGQHAVLSGEPGQMPDWTFQIIINQNFIRHAQVVALRDIVFPTLALNIHAWTYLLEAEHGWCSRLLVSSSYIQCICQE